MWNGHITHFMNFTQALAFQCTQTTLSAKLYSISGSSHRCCETSQFKKKKVLVTNWSHFRKGNQQKKQKKASFSVLFVFAVTSSSRYSQYTKLKLKIPLATAKFYVKKNIRRIEKENTNETVKKKILSVVTLMLIYCKFLQIHCICFICIFVWHIHIS